MPSALTRQSRHSIDSSVLDFTHLLHNTPLSASIPVPYLVEFLNFSKNGRPSPLNTYRVEETHVENKKMRKNAEKIGIFNIISKCYSNYHSHDKI